MSGIGKMYRREVNGVLQDIEAVSASVGIYQDSIDGFWYALEPSLKRRGAFKTAETARKWCRVSSTLVARLPETNTQYDVFNEAMKTRGWRIVRLLGDCQIWELSHSPETVGVRILGEAANQEKVLVRDDLARPSQFDGKA